MLTFPEKMLFTLAALATLAAVYFAVRRLVRLITAGHGQGAAGAKIPLEVDDDERGGFLHGLYPRGKIRGVLDRGQGLG